MTPVEKVLKCSTSCSKENLGPVYTVKYEQTSLQWLTRLSRAPCYRLHFTMTHTLSSLSATWVYCLSWNILAIFCPRAFAWVLILCLYGFSLKIATRPASSPPSSCHLLLLTPPPLYFLEHLLPLTVLHILNTFQN